MMTRKHFNAIAEAIRITRYNARSLVLTDLIRNLEPFFKSENPAFDETRFIDATY